MQPRRRPSPLLMNGHHTAEEFPRNNTRKHIQLCFFMVVVCAIYYIIDVSEKDYMKKSSARMEVLNQPINLQSKPSKRSFILEPEDEFTPQICWLMSFPNSGTSFTMTMVARASNRSFASNYADEVTAPDQMDSLSIYPRRPEGPYWAGLSGKIAFPRQLPEKYIITKTHCGSRCVNCGPDEYVETPAVFLRKCASGHARMGNQRRRVDVEYPPDRVYRAIHLIRHPLHNIIARFHLEHRHRDRSGKYKSWVATHPNNATGLQSWCADLNEEFRTQDERFFGKESLPNVPCRGEFFKFTQWHNLVHEGLELIEHEVPVLTVYYEDYQVNFNETVKTILDFLELKHVGVLREFQARSDYGEYFTKEQRQEIFAFIKKTANTKTWKQIEHYFGDGYYD